MSADKRGVHPQAPINQASADWQDTKAAYAFFDNPHTLPAEILLPHQQRSLERMAAHPLVLAREDSTILADPEWKALYTAIHRRAMLPATPPTVRQAVRWIAQLGGFWVAKAMVNPVSPLSGAAGLV
jgi:hypothetical protein